MYKRVVLLVIGSAFLLMLPNKMQAQPQKVMADKIVAVVGTSAILYSEVDELSKQLIQQRREQGFTLDRDPKAEALENLLMQKLLYNQSLVDSLKVSIDDIPEMVEQRIQEAIKHMGSISALEAFYHKPVFEIKDDMRNKLEENRHAQYMQQEIESKVKITPGEVDRYYKSIDKDSLPIIPEQYVFAQITKFPPSTIEAKQRAREDILALKERIQKGDRFDALARAYSVDPGSAMRGGEMDFMPKDGFVKPFADALVKLKVGQISEVVETDFGYHIIQLLEKKGDLYRMRHILLKPNFTEEELSQTTATLDSLVTKIHAKELTFEEAALKNSDDMFSRQNGGLVTNHEMLEMYNAFDAKLTSTRFLKEDLNNRDVIFMKDLKPGELTGAFITQDMKGNIMGKVIKLIEIIPAHPASLKEDYLKLEEIALENKKEKEFKKWLNSKIEGMYVRIEPEFKDAEFENKTWLK